MFVIASKAKQSGPLAADWIASSRARSRLAMTDLNLRNYLGSAKLQRRLTFDRLALALTRLAAEEQRLAHHGRDDRGLERFCDQESRLRPLAGQEPLRIGGDEDHRHFK